MPLCQSSFWGRKTFCVITGASQGIGRQLSIEFSQKVKDNSIFLLMARSSSGLEETSRLIQDVSPNVKVSCHSVDFTQIKTEEYTQVIRNTFAEFNVSPQDFELAMIVHNAGSAGDVSEKASEMLDPKKWTEYLYLNLISVTCLNSVFLQSFPIELMKEICVVNITSLCGIQPFKTMGYYCIGKAAREMYFKVLAEESPLLNVISYSPGPVDTEMISQVTDHLGDPDVKAQFIANNKNILTPEQTSKRCINVLSARKYISGDRVDYFDDKY